MRARINAGTGLSVLHPFLLLILLLGATTSNAMDWKSVKQTIRQRFSGVSHISVERLNEWLEDDTLAAPILIDVREPEEYAVSHLPGAVRARDEDDVLAMFEDILPDTAIVLYCSVGYRSSELAEKLSKRGFTDVRNLEGSLFEWANTGLPLLRGTDPVTVVHPYDESWGTLVDREMWLFRPDNEE